MFRTAAPPVRPATAAAVAGTVPCLLRAAWHLPTGPSERRPPRPEVEAIHRWTAETHGTRVDGDRFAASPLWATPDLVAGAVDALGPLPAADAPQIAVLAYATPDFEHTRLAASLLHGLLPGEPLTFAVSDQGVLSPFTALRVAVEYARRSGWNRLLLVVVDQSSQPFPRPETGQLAVDRDAAAALLLGWEGGAAPVAGLGQGRPEQALPALRADLADAGLLAAGLGLADGPELPLSGPLRRDAVPGRPCTGVWSALRDAPAGRVVLADLDRGLDRLAHCTLDLPDPQEGSDDGNR
ncbi:hypothetical protein [Streptacidiphilus melanogenes]|uniref:hypothetical protein n=1 Tax=Streptacidiphilus melanogenes TaxID=411235 RepID=UPI0005AAFCA8|nr:hypothetical protein [Streptacidiphilus melanogenes]